MGINVHELAAGPLLWVSLCVFALGFMWKAFTLLRLTVKKEEPYSHPLELKKQQARPVSEEESKLDRIARIRNSVFWQHPVMATVSLLFHVCLIATPLLLLAHNVMIKNAIGIMPPSIPEGLSDLMTMFVLVCGLFFLVRRIAVPKVSAISSGYDYLVLAITIAPYLTGFLAHHQILDYKTMITLHMLTGEVMLIVLPFTKIGHMVFFFFTRLHMSGEFCLGPGSRRWRE